MRGYKPKTKLGAKLQAKASTYDPKTPIGKKILGEPATVDAVDLPDDDGPQTRYSENGVVMFTDLADINTLADAFSNTVRRCGDKRALGTRTLLATEQVWNERAGKNFEKVTLGRYEWLSYEDVGARVESFASGLSSLGQVVGSPVAIYADTSANWMIAAQACFSRSYPVVTVYANLGAEAIAHALSETEVTLLITDKKLVKTFASVADQCPSIRCVVSSGGVDEKVASALASVQVLSFEDVEQLPPSDSVAVRPEPASTAVIMYTSGSTGVPKGVVLSHENFMSCMKGLAAIPNPPFNSDDIYMAYLPLAHVMELLAETSAMSHGFGIGYGHPTTLSSFGSRLKEGSVPDVAALKPTLMAAVPLIMDRIRKSVESKVSSSPAPQKKLFEKAYNTRLGEIEKGNTEGGMVDQLAFKKIRNSLGGNLRLMLSGGAPLSPATQRFMNICFGIPVAQGYGATETTGASCITRPDDPQVGTVGSPIGCCTVQLRDWAEGGYLVADKDNPAIGRSRGEIVIGGPNVAMGYFKNDEKTAESFTTDDNGVRWFYTGDIGELQEDGVYRIIDRKKDLVKLQQGEYVSLGRVENVLKESPFVANVCVYADASRPFCIALVQPAPEALMTWAEEAGCLPSGARAPVPMPEVEDEEEGADADVNTEAANTSPEQGSVLTTVVRLPEANAAVLASLKQVGKAGKLQGFEIPARCYLCSEEWTPENDLVTAALKLRRNNIKTFYSEKIEATYSS